MNRPELYNKTVDILYQAYFNDTLEHANCYACAVGNIIAANKGLRLVKDFEPSHLGQVLYWEGWTPYRIKCIAQTASTFPSWFQIIRPWFDEHVNSVNEEIAATGYSILEIREIERAFEHCTFGESPEDYMFNGLCAVLEVLREIHEVTDDDLLQANNKRFADHYKLKTAAV